MLSPVTRLKHSASCRLLGVSHGGQILSSTAGASACNHPEVDRISEFGLYEQYALVHSKILFYLLQHGCNYVFLLWLHLPAMHSTTITMFICGLPAISSYRLLSEKECLAV